ncbi:SPOR domain-containing protein [Bradyrhizobium sp. dw_411]|uniref:SPOR domain-containing protein n=1 Tax=Bradyrhizobium sp. dw_411 TaxID=2720082 RepID=UPI001BCE4E80|nr:SPOR domain-containing protein [Bradyrhizobium sp. dw_411]
MADRYQDRPFPADDDYGHGGDQYASAKGDSDPLAELARLIGQTDPFGSMGRANLPLQQHVADHDQHDQYELPVEEPPAGPPPWMQRAARQETPPPPAADYPSAPDYPSSVHPLHRYAVPQAAPEPEPEYHPAPPLPLADDGYDPDPARYDDALYGALDSGAQDTQHAVYADDAYAYQDGYDDGVEERAPKRRGGLATVVGVLALAVLGTGGALAYRTYVGSPRSGEPPIIRADAGPTKIVPAPTDGSSKLPDRMAAGDGMEKIVPREETPLDLNAKNGPRVVFPPLNQNGNPPPVASVTPNAPPQPTNAGNGTLPNAEPRKVRTLSVRGDQPDSAAVPVTSAAAAKSAPAVRTAAAQRIPPAAANANDSTANAPLSLSPQAAAQAALPPAPTRMAATTPVQIAPQAAPSAAAGGGYLVQVSSQRNEADAQASYRALQGKFPSVLGSRSPVIKRADLGDKGVYYRAMVGPFGSPDEAKQFCGSLTSAGGQCVVQRN